jgi:DNA invertase Pin-like site-specific DNA recombinase
MYTCLDLSEDNPYDYFLITIMTDINQLERYIIHMRKHEGIELAKKEGGVTENQIRKIINVSRTLLYGKLLSEGNK